MSLYDNLSKNILTDSHENLVHVHRGLCRCLHEEQTVVICVWLCILWTPNTRIFVKHNLTGMDIGNYFKVPKRLKPVGNATNLEVECSLISKVSLVPCQGYYNVWTGLSLKLFNPVFCPYKWLLEQTERWEVFFLKNKYFSSLKSKTQDK